MMTRSNTDLPEYDNPPVIELVMGCRFTPLTLMKLPHFGLFWYTVMQDFPNCEQAPPIADRGELFLEPGLGYPLPRVWLINQNDDHLIQIQKDRFLFNWRRRDRTYPHYVNIKPLFAKYFGMFVEHADRYGFGDVEVGQFELAYINVIPLALVDNKFDNIGRIVPSLSPMLEEGYHTEGVESMACSLSRRMADNLGSLSINTSRATAPEGEEVLRMEIRARGQHENMEQWFDLAHKSIVLTFADLIDHDFQREHFGGGKDV